MTIKNNNISIYRIGINVVLYIFAVVGFWAVLQSTSDLEANNDHAARENLLKAAFMGLCMFAVSIVNFIKKKFFKKGKSVTSSQTET